MSKQFDDAVEQLSGKPSFSFSELVKLVPPENDDAAERMRSSLAEDERFFCDEPEENFYPREEFFRDFEFVVTPCEEEIKQGILCAGHRFAAFVHPDIFASETVLRIGGRAAAKKEYCTTLGNALEFYLLLGAGGIFDTLLAEHPDNKSLRQDHSPQAGVKFDVFDLGSFYERHLFEAGDALLCRVVDYRKGVISAKFLPGDKRKHQELNEFQKEFSDALEKVINRFGENMDVPEQLRYALFTRGKKPAVGQSLDEFMRSCPDFEIGFSEWGESTLIKKNEDDDDFSPEIPDFVGISKGETGNLDKLLEELKLPLTGVEIDSFIMDMAYARELDYEAFFNRVFGAGKLDFADEAQEAVFHNYVEDRWEELTTNYQRYEDETKGPLRSLLLEVISDRLSLAASGSEPDEELKRRRKENTGKIDELLAMLNRIDYTVDDNDAENIEETIAALREEMEALYE